MFSIILCFQHRRTNSVKMTRSVKLKKNLGAQQVYLGCAYLMYVLVQ